MAECEISTEGVVTLGEELLAHLGVGPGAELEIELLPAGLIGLKAAKPSTDRPADETS